MKDKKRFLSLLLCGALLFSLLPQAAFAKGAGNIAAGQINEKQEASGFSIEGGTSGTDYTLEGNTLTIQTSTPLTISTTGNGAITGQIVIAENVKANLTFNEVTLNGVNGGNGTQSKSAIELSSGSSLTLTLAANSSNTLNGGNGGGPGAPGIHVPEETTLTVLCGAAGDNKNHICSSDAGCGQLTVKGGDAPTNIGGVGIGGDVKSGSNSTYTGGSCGTVFLLGGVMTITGGKDSDPLINNAGRDIGGGRGSGGNGGDGGTVIILTKVTSNNDRLDIGGGEASTGNQAGDNGAGIKPSDANNTYEVYGDLTLPGDLTIPERVTVKIPSGATLELPEETTLTNNGTIKIETGGTLDGGNGITGSGVLDYGYNNGTFTYSINCDAPDTVTITGLTESGKTMTAIEIPAKITRNDENNDTRSGEQTYDVTAIGNNAFWSCTNLTTVTFEDGSESGNLTTIKSYAFEFCTSLKDINIPNSVETIEMLAFNGSGLERVVVSSGIKNWDGAFYGCENLMTVTIPEGVKDIAGSAFQGCEKLESIIIPHTVEEISVTAFSGCEGLKNVTFEGNSQLKTIEGLAFENCTALGSIVIPASVTTIESFEYAGTIHGAFEGCTNLENVTFPQDSQITNIAPETFEGCDLSKLVLYHYNNSTVADFASEHGIKAENLLHTVTVTVQDNVGGTASASPTSAAQDEIITLTASPATGYHFKGWQVLSGGVTITDNKFTMPDEAVEITAIFERDSVPERNYFTITASAGTGGSISPSGSVSVLEEQNQTFTITPEKGHYISDVRVDGKSVGAARTYTFEKVSAQHTIEAFFAETDDGGDSVSPPVIDNTPGGTEGTDPKDPNPGDETASAGEAETAQKARKLTAPKKVTVSPSYNKVKVSWKKVKGATGYQVYRSAKKNGKYKKVKTTKARTWTNRKLKTGKTYYYKVRAYKKEKGKTVCGKFSARKKAKVRPAAPALKVRASKGGVTARWSSVAGATRYQLYRASKKNGKYYRWRETVRKGYVDRKKLRKGKVYYYKARAYRVVNGTKIYGKFSKVKKVRAK